ncbi:hypothetical protein HY251_18025 [bacterium]|nr:hypothetical protein [bacterium]
MRLGGTCVAALVSLLALAAPAGAKQGGGDPPGGSPAPPTDPGSRRDGGSKEDGARDGAAGNKGDGAKDPPRKTREDLKKEYDAAYLAHAKALIEVDVVRDHRDTADRGVEPARERVRLLSKRSNDDPDKKAAMVELLKKIQETELSKIEIELGKAERIRDKARKTAIVAGRVYLKRILENVDLLRDIRGAQAKALLEESFHLTRDVENLEKLDQLPLTPMKTFEPEVGDDFNPTWIERQLALYRPHADRCEEIAADLTERVDEYEKEQTHWVHLKELGVMLDEGKERLGKVETNLKETKAARDAADKNAKAIREEIDRLQKRLKELNATKPPETRSQDSRKEAR